MRNIPRVIAPVAPMATDTFTIELCKPGRHEYWTFCDGQKVCVTKGYI